MEINTRILFTSHEPTKEKAIEKATLLKEIYPECSFRIEPSSALFVDGSYKSKPENEVWNINSLIFYYGNTDKPILAERGIII